MSIGCGGMLHSSLAESTQDLRATGQPWINHFRATECSNKPTILIVISFYCVSARAEPSLLDQRKHKLPLPTQHGLFSLFIFIPTLSFIQIFSYGLILFKISENQQSRNDFLRVSLNIRVCILVRWETRGRGWRGII